MNATAADAANADDALLFVPPSGYRALCITNLILCSISSILCVVLIAAMTLPLLSPKRRKKYSTYNLYLAYLAIPDLAANAFIVCIVLTHTNNWIHPELESSDQQQQWMFDHPFDHNIYILTVAANLYTNAFLTLEIFRLLKNSNLRKRHYPPTIAKVSKQVMISYGLGGFMFLLDYWIADRLVGAGINLYRAFSLVFVVIIPLSILVVVSTKIYRQGLIRSTGSMHEGRLKVLILYFARIVLADILLWLPASIAYTVSWSLEEATRTKIIAYHISIVFTGIQPLVNFGCSLTKPDARKLVVDLLQCVCCRQFCVGGRRRGEGDDDHARYSYGDPYLRASSSLPATRSSEVRKQSKPLSITSSAIDRTSLFSSQESGQRLQSTLEGQLSSQANHTNHVVGGGKKAEDPTTPQLDDDNDNDNGGDDDATRLSTKA